MDEKDRKKKLREWRAQQRRVTGSRFPLPEAELEALFDALDSELSSRACSHTLKFCRTWLAARGHAVEIVIEWLKDNGGYCDCEVLMNVEPRFDASRNQP